MFRRLLVMFVLSVTIIITTGRATLAFQATYRLPCMIFYPGEPPISTNCVANIKASANSWVYVVKTSNGNHLLLRRMVPRISTLITNHATRYRTSHTRVIKIER